MKKSTVQHMQVNKSDNVFIVEALSLVCMLLFTAGLMHACQFFRYTVQIYGVIHTIGICVA